LADNRAVFMHILHLRPPFSELLGARGGLAPERPCSPCETSVWEGTRGPV